MIKTMTKIVIKIEKVVTDSFGIFARAIAIAIIVMLGANFKQIIAATGTLFLEDNCLEWIVNISIGVAGTLLFSKLREEDDNPFTFNIVNIVFEDICLFTLMILSEFLIWHRDQIETVLTVLTIRDFKLMTVGIWITIVVINSKIFVNENDKKVERIDDNSDGDEE